MKVRVFSGEPKEVERDLNNFFDLVANINNVKKILQSESPDGNGYTNLTITIFHGD